MWNSFPTIVIATVSRGTELVILPGACLREKAPEVEPEGEI